jgi:hypothetical protein
MRRACDVWRYFSLSVHARASCQYRVCTVTIVPASYESLGDTLLGGHVSCTRQLFVLSKFSLRACTKHFLPLAGERVENITRTGL